MVPEIWRATDIIFCHSGLFFAPLPPYGPRKSKFWKKWKKHMKILSFDKYRWQSNFTNIDGSSDMECNGHNFLSFWTVHCSFTSLTTPKKKILKKWKNCLEILSFYTGLTYRPHGHNFLSFSTIFCPFTLLATWKMKLWKNKKTPRDIIILHMCTIHENHMMYGSWDMEHVTD